MANILVVDDDVHLLKSMEEWLLHEHHSVDAVGAGIQGWELIQGNSYDLVLLDWQLPDMSGLEVLRKFRSRGGTTPILILTERSDLERTVEGLDYGADDYLTKPFHMKEFVARIRTTLRKMGSVLSSRPLSTNSEILEQAELVGTGLARRYEFLELIGQGGFGRVYKARHPQLDKLVAIKMIQKNELNEEVIARFEQEARAVSRLDHPNIATVYDFGTTERMQPYMVMEFIVGQALDEVIREYGALPVEQALEIFMQIADGMWHAHNAGILHRDLKLSNFMLKELPDSSGGHVLKVLDFGCAKFRDPERKAPGLTLVGQVVGSPLYMSPEAAHGNELDERADVYSLGCVMYQVLTGQVPFRGNDAIAVMVKHVSEAPLSLAKCRPDLSFSEPLEQMISKCLAKDAANRFQSMIELKTELENIKYNKSSKRSRREDSFTKITNSIRELFSTKEQRVDPLKNQKPIDPPHTAKPSSQDSSTTASESDRLTKPAAKVNEPIRLRQQPLQAPIVGQAPEEPEAPEEQLSDQERYSNWAVKLNSALGKANESHFADITCGYIQLNELLKETFLLYPAPHTAIGDHLNSMGAAAACLGLMDRAEQLYLFAIGNMEQTIGSGHVRTARIKMNLADAYRKHDRYAPAQQQFKEAYDVMQRSANVDQDALNDTAQKFLTMRKRMAAENESRETLKQILELISGRELQQAELVARGADTKLSVVFPKDHPVFVPIWKAHSQALSNLSRFIEADILQCAADHVEKMRSEQMAFHRIVDSQLPPIPNVKQLEQLHKTRAVAGK